MNANGLEYEAEAGLDWLTVTTTAHNIGHSMLDVYNSYKTGGGRPVGFFGFECLRDEDGLTWGQRPSDGRYILIAPGATAAAIFRKLVPLPVRVTRIDLACDVWLDVPRDQVAQSARVPLSPAHDSNVRCTYITGRTGKKRDPSGDTLYLGSRSSTQYGRVYDKGRQQKTAEPGKWFRYEVEFKQVAARQMAAVARQLDPGQYGEWIKCTVYDWFLKRAVSPLFYPDTDTPGTTIRSQYKQSTSDKKLAWLRSQVQPTVKYLFQQGLKNEALDALGVELVQIKDDVYHTISG